MKSPRKRTRPSQTPVVLYPRDLEKIKMHVVDDVLTQVTAYLMDEFDYDEDKIVELWEGIARYSKAIKEHTISIKKVKEIIKEHTGINLVGWK